MRHPARILCLFVPAPALLLEAGCQEESTPEPEPAASTAPVGQSNVPLRGSETALSTFLPARQLALSFLTAGPVSTVDVHVGSEVEAGELIAALDTSDLELAVQEAEETLAVSRARFAQAQAGPQEEAVAVAVDVHVGSEVNAGASPEELAVAQTQPDQARRGPRPEDVAVAEAQMQQACTTLAQAQLAAPSDGTVSAVYLHPGERATAGTPVVELLDTGAGGSRRATSAG